MVSETITSDLNLHPIRYIDLQKDGSSRSQILESLVQENHDLYGIRIHENLEHHNHTPHILGSAFRLGASEEQLKDIYAESISTTQKWNQPPETITDDNFIQHLGKAEFQKAYVDYFSKTPGDWKTVFDKYLFGGAYALMNSLMSGLTHPMIHLAYAVEFNSRELAIEALGLAATCHDSMHTYLEREYTIGNLEPLQIINNIRNDARFNETRMPSIGSLEPLFEISEDAFLEHWNSWIPNINQLELAQKLAVALLAAPSENDFGLCHALTSFHALRVILPVVEGNKRISLARQWFLWVMGAYVMVGRPVIDYSLIEHYDLNGRDWAWVKEQALTGKYRKEHHFVKAVRAIVNAEETWGDDDGFYLKAAVRFIDKFEEWTGFGDVLPSFQRHIVRC